MTGYPSPPHPGQPYPTYPSAPYQQPRWSALAITAFVLSLLGFLGFTAILGIILGIAGIVVTSGGKRRGMGLAIAAIPISLITGAVSLLIVVSLVFFMRAAQIPMELKPILESTQIDSNVVASVRKISAPSLDAKLSDEEIVAWLNAVREKHGVLTSLQDLKPGGQSGDGQVTFTLSGRFVNGPASVRLEIRPDSMFDIRLNELAVGTLSLRDFAEGGSTPATPGGPETAEPTAGD